MTKADEGSVKKTILVLDDDLDYLLEKRVQLEMAGYRVLEAPTAAKGNEIIKDTKPDLVIADLKMEEEDSGLNVCYNIKNAYPDVPVILITGWASETGLDFDTARSDRYGRVKADAFLAKPILFDDLKAEIRRLLREQ